MSYDNTAPTKITAYLWHCFTFQGSQKFLPEPANSHFIHGLILKSKPINSVYTRVIYAWILLHSSFLQSWLCAVAEASRKENNVSCSWELTLHMSFLPEILRIESWYALTSCLFLRPLVSHPRQKRSHTRSARQILWDWALLHHVPFGVSNLFHTGDSSTQRKHLFYFKACFVIIKITEPVFTCLVRSSMHNAPPPRTYLETNVKENTFDIIS